jgi:COP9 signalosome complex subunit 3
MDKLLPLLLSFPVHPPPIQPLSDEQYDEGIKSQVKNLRKLPGNTLLQATSGGEDILNVGSPHFNSVLLANFVQIINPALNSIPYAFALLARTTEVQNTLKSAQNNTPPVDLMPLWEKIVHFLENFDSRQVRYIGPETLEIITIVAGLARHLGQVFCQPNQPHI